ncbi:MAG TPA: hypothetical protein VGC47_02335 [Acidimicrobiia bacterium]|jgi:hypothetical protein
MTNPKGDVQFDVVDSGYDIEQVNQYIERADSSDAPSRLNAELLKRATKRIEELEHSLSTAPPDAAGVRELESRMRDLHAEVGDRIGTMSTAYQRLVSELRTMSVSLQELSALSAAMSETLQDVNAAGSQMARPEVDSPFALDVPTPAVPVQAVAADRVEVSEEPAAAQPSPPAPAAQPSPPAPAAPSGEDSALAAVADRLLATLAGVEASLDAAVDGDAWMNVGIDGTDDDSAQEDEEVEVPPVEAEVEIAAEEPEPPAPDVDAAEKRRRDVDAATKRREDDDAAASGRTGSFYSRRSAKLPRLADAGQDALAAAKSLRGVLND